EVSSVIVSCSNLCAHAFIEIAETGSQHQQYIFINPPCATLPVFKLIFRRPSRINATKRLQNVTHLVKLFITTGEPEKPSIIAVFFCPSRPCPAQVCDPEQDRRLNCHR